MPASAASFDLLGTGIDKFASAYGDFKEASAYKAASKLEYQNADITRQSFAIKKLQAQRELFRTVGGQQADVAGAGLNASGSAGDLLRSSMQEGALTHQLLGAQGQIDVNSYNVQGGAYAGQASAAKAKGFGDIIGGITSIAGAVILSDRRLKERFVFEGFDANHNRIWTFCYLGEDERWRGVIAQEVMEKRPDAVKIDQGTGYLMVDYDAIGAKMERV